MRFFEWTVEHCDDLSGSWLECEAADGLYLEVTFLGPGLSYRPTLTYGQDIDDTAYGPTVNNISEAQDIAVEMFYGWCMQTAIEAETMAMELNR